MFPYADPTGTDVLSRNGALELYRIEIDRLYRNFGDLPDSAFVVLEAFDELSDNAQPTFVSVPWVAFPRSVAASADQIDSNRFQFQDEYVEWRVEKDRNGRVERVTFTTEFPEYYQALASIGIEALLAGIQAVIPDANPALEDFFGPGFDPAQASPRERAVRLRTHGRLNPWNNGEKGILFLGQPANTLGALFNLVGACAVRRANIPPQSVCAAVGGACGPGRNSDPQVCVAAQNAARDPRHGISLADPVGIHMVRLDGEWEIDDRVVDINDPNANQGRWQISRNGRRGVLDLAGATIRVDGNLITSGTQVSTKLVVAADVIMAPEESLPSWARTGFEFLRGPA